MKKDKNKKEDRARMDVSLDDVRDMIWEALRDRFGKDEEAWVNQVYGSYIIYQHDGKYFRLPYSILEGDVQLGNEPIEVERVWVETRSAQSEGDDMLTDSIRLVQSKDPEGSVWDVTICEPGFTKNGWYHPDDVLRECAGLFEGADVNIYELPSGGADHVMDGVYPIKSLLTKNKAAWIDNVRHVAGVGVKGVLHFLDSFKWLGKNLLKAKDEGQEAYGLSYDAPARSKQSVIDGKRVMELVKLLAVDSVDIVTRPAAGGKFNRAVAGMPATKKEDDFMDKKTLWEMIEGARPKLLEGKEFETIPDDELEGLARMAMTPKEPKEPEDGDAPNNPGSDEGATKDDITLLRCEMSLKDTLGDSDLPDVSKDRIRATFSEKVFKQEDLDTAIAAEKDYLASLTPEGGEDDDLIPGGRVQMGLNSAQKVEMAIDRTFGLSQDEMKEFADMERLDHQRVFMSIGSPNDFDDYSSVQPFRSLGEMYAMLTGDPEVTGVFNPRNIPKELRAAMAITSSTFTYLLGNTMGRRLIKAYKRPNYNEQLLISTKKPVKDFRQQEAVKIGGFNKLEDVDPETGEYQEIAAITDEEATYTVTTRGNILTITRKTIKNDDLTVVQRFIDALGVAAAWTHADFVWSFIVDNSTCADGTALFTSDHGNLGAAALTIATANTALVALAKMTEKDSSRRLGLLDDENVTAYLAHPPDLRAKAVEIATHDWYYASNDLTTKTANPCKGKVKPVQCSLLTDATDWAMFLPGSEVDMIEMGYMDGRENPEMFLADSPQSEAVFVADNIRYKLRHEYSGTPVDYVGAYKAEV